MASQPPDPRSREGLLAAVAVKGITDVDGLWRSVGRTGGIKETLKGTSPQLQREDLLAGLLDLAAEAAEAKDVPWWRRHGLDLAVLAALAVTSCLVLRAVPLASASGIAKRSLSAGQWLRAEDVSAVRSPEKILNRPLRRAVRAGEPMYVGDLGAAAILPPAQLAGKLTVRLRIDRAELRRLPILPGQASLLFAAEAKEGQPGAGIVLRDVPVLSAVTEGGDSHVVVALAPEQLEAVRGFVHDGRALVLAPAH